MPLLRAMVVARVVALCLSVEAQVGSDRLVASVNRERLSGDEVRQRRRKEQGRSTDVGRSPDTLQGNRAAPSGKPVLHCRIIDGVTSGRDLNFAPRRRDESIGLD